MKAVHALLIGLLAVTTGLAQTPTRDRPRLDLSGTATISGTVVVDDDRRGPLRRAVVTLSRAGVEDMRTTSTDDQGRFTFADLPAAAYTLGASKGGYVSISFGAPRPGMPGSPISLTDGERFSVAPIALIGGAAIAGRIRDRNGRPIAGASVQASQFVVVNGERRRRTTTGSWGAASTNAHGEYRIYGLLAGEYVVYANPPFGPEVREVTAAELNWERQRTGPVPAPGRPSIFASTIFPGTADAVSATTIALARGEERVGVDFPMLFVPASRVSGAVVGPDGQPAANITIMCTPRQLSELFPTPSPCEGGLAGADGTFGFSNVPPGDFVLLARTRTPPAGRGGGAPAPQIFWGTADVRVSGLDVRDVSIQLQPGMSVTGQVVFARATSTSSSLPPIDPSRVQVQLVPFDSSPHAIRVPARTANADGTFTIDGLTPGTFRLTATVPAPFSRDWLMKSAVIEGKDVVDGPLDVRSGQSVSGVVVTFSDVQTGLSGALTDTTGRPAPGFYVFAFAVDRTYWTPESRRIASARASVTGSYALTGLPPGEYYLCALTEIDTTLQYDATYLEQFIPASIKMTIAEGEKRRQDLRIGG